MGQQDRKFAVIKLKTCHKQSSNEQFPACPAFRINPRIAGDVDFPLPACGFGPERRGNADQAFGNALYAGKKYTVAIKLAGSGQRHRLLDIMLLGELPYFFRRKAQFLPAAGVGHLRSRLHCNQ
jgi:hypothetical protein